MRSEAAKTAAFLLAALVLVAAAAWIEPGAATPEVLSDEGEPLFPQFHDVNQVKAIEVIAYDADQAVATPLKVEFRGHRWLLPSHHDYPAEAGDRLAKTAGALLDLKKDIVVSDRVEDHATYGVIDPLDMKVASLAGRGKHVTLRDAGGGILADVVLGNKMPDHEGYRYLRLPNHKRIYGVKTVADPSANFKDWVEGNLLRLSSSRIRKMTVNSYSIDETRGRLVNAQRVVATRRDGKWSVTGTRQVSRAKAGAAATALASIRIVGAWPKPKMLAEQLRKGQLQMSLEAVMSLRQRGFFFTPAGRLLASQGEVVAETNTGLVYSLRFGEIAAGSASGEKGSDSKKAKTAGQDRYVFVIVHYDPKLASRGKSSGERTARYLTRKFADWYYVISGDEFAKIRMQ